MSLSDADRDLLAEDLDSGEESPYRRRPRAVEVRRGRLPRLRRLLRWSFSAGVTLALLGFGGFQLIGFVLASPRFRLNPARDVVVEGNRFVSREEILTALALPPDSATWAGANVFRVSLEEKRKRVESIPWVRSATLTRSFPHWLSVRLVERDPVAFVNMGGRVELVDAEGVLIEKPERADFAFPVVFGLGAGMDVSERRARLALYQQFVRELSGELPTSGWIISEVGLSDADDLKALLVQGRETVQVHFGDSGFQERFSEFLGLLPELRKSNAKIDSVDLRYRNQIVVNPEPAESKKGGGGEPGADHRD